MLHIVYRSTGKENRKPRPGFYSKMLSLLSLLFATEALPEEKRREIIFLNDAPVAAANHDVMEAFGEVIDVPNLTLRKSLRFATDLPRLRNWNDDDIVYFAEDDYLYQPDAFISLLAAAEQMPRPSYFAFYASAGGLEPSGRPVPPELRVVQRPGKSIVAAGHEWRPALSTTSSFAAHVHALRQDLWLHRLAPRSGGAWDHVISLAHQGHAPFRWKQVVEPLVDANAGLVRATLHSGLRATLNLGAVASKLHWHPLMAPSPCLATHMELPHMAAGVDWTAVVEQTQDWAAQHSLPLDWAAPVRDVS